MGQRVDEYGIIPDFSFLAFSRRYVIIAYDAGDVKDNFSVKAARHQLTEYLLSMGASVGWLEWNVKRNGREAKGVDDWLAPLIGDFVSGSSVWRSHHRSMETSPHGRCRLRSGPRHDFDPFFDICRQCGLNWLETIQDPFRPCMATEETARQAAAKIEQCRREDDEEFRKRIERIRTNPPRRGR